MWASRDLKVPICSVKETKYREDYWYSRSLGQEAIKGGTSTTRGNDSGT